jgi:hypothetical protein
VAGFFNKRFRVAYFFQFGTLKNFFAHMLSRAITPQNNTFCQLKNSKFEPDLWVFSILKTQKYSLLRTWKIIVQVNILQRKTYQKIDLVEIYKLISKSSKSAYGNMRYHFLKKSVFVYFSIQDRYSKKS